MEKNEQQRGYFGLNSVTGRTGIRKYDFNYQLAPESSGEIKTQEIAGVEMILHTQIATSDYNSRMQTAVRLLNTGGICLAQLNLGTGEITGVNTGLEQRMLYLGNIVKTKE